MVIVKFWNSDHSASVVYEHVWVAPLTANVKDNGAAATAMFNNLPCVFSMLQSVYRRAETRRTGRDERRQRRGGGGRGGGSRCVRSWRRPRAYHSVASSSGAESSRVTAAIVVVLRNSLPRDDVSICARRQKRPPVEEFETVWSRSVTSRWDSEFDFFLLLHRLTFFFTVPKVLNVQSKRYSRSTSLALRELYIRSTCTSPPYSLFLHVYFALSSVCLSCSRVIPLRWCLTRSRWLSGQRFQECDSARPRGRLARISPQAGDGDGWRATSVTVNSVSNSEEVDERERRTMQAENVTRWYAYTDDGEWSTRQSRIWG